MEAALRSSASFPLSLVSWLIDHCEILESPSHNDYLPAPLRWETRKAFPSAFLQWFPQVPVFYVTTRLVNGEWKEYPLARWSLIGQKWGARRRSLGTCPSEDACATVLFRGPPEKG